MKTYIPENAFLIIAGPTGTGKSSVAVELCKILPGEIINIDSRQIYKEITVGIAKPTAMMMKQVPHHLYGFISLKERFTVFDYRQYIEKVVSEIWSRGKTAIAVGGSGFYIRAILKGIFDLPDETKSFQNDIRRHLSNKETSKLYNTLKGVDPVLAERIHPNDRFRVIRGLEIWLTTGIPMSQWQKQAKPAGFISRAFVKYWVMNLPRDVLYNQLDTRTETMLKSGWVNEVKTLIQTGFQQYLAEKAPIGYMELCDFINGKISWKETVETIKRKTRNYARQQVSWFKREKAEWVDALNSSPQEIAMQLYASLLKSEK